MNPYLDDGDAQLYLGDCLDVMRELPADSVDAIITDPPYGLEFMGKEWDRPWAVSPSNGVGYAGRDDLTLPAHRDNRNANCRACGGRQRGAKRCKCDAPDWDRDPASDMRAFQAWCEAWAREALRIAKPGAHLLAFGGTRTAHRLTTGIEDAGWEIRDTLAWMYGSGFPKSLDVSKAIDKAAGAERAIVGQRTRGTTRPSVDDQSGGVAYRYAGTFDQTAPATGDAQRWAGWGTALKPAYEPIVLARKPLRGTVAANVLQHGTGALNIDGCRIATNGERPSGGTPNRPRDFGPNGGAMGAGASTVSVTHDAGRWPANVVLDEHAARMLDAQTGELTSGANPKRRGADGDRTAYGAYNGQDDANPQRGVDSGGASRFYYTAKADAEERIAPDGTRNTHPTVKPTDLMRWLVRLATPPGGVVLDPFAGSGSTGVAARAEGFRSILIEREEEYARIAASRLAQLTLLGGDQ